MAGHVSHIYDLAHHESPIAQWLERPNGIWKVMGSTPVGGSENYFSEYFDLRTPLHCLHFIQVTNHLSKLIQFSRLNVNLPLVLQEKQIHLDKMSSGLDTAEKHGLWKRRKQYKTPLYRTLFCKFYKITLIRLCYITVIMPTDLEIKVLVTD